jgi:hypothetical protein
VQDAACEFAVFGRSAGQTWVSKLHKNSVLAAQIVDSCEKFAQSFGLDDWFKLGCELFSCSCHYGG